MLHNKVILQNVMSMLISNSVTQIFHLVLKLISIDLVIDLSGYATMVAHIGYPTLKYIIIIRKSNQHHQV